MSIQYCVAATLVRGAIEEANYRLLSDPEVTRLIGVTTLEEGLEFTHAYPRLQGTQVTVTLRGGRTVTRQLPDVIPATPSEIRAWFRCSCEQVLGAAASREIEAIVDSLERQEDVGALSELLSGSGRRMTA